MVIWNWVLGETDTKIKAKKQIFGVKKRSQPQMQIKFNDKTVVSNISAIYEIFEEL